MKNWILIGLLAGGCGGSGAAATTEPSTAPVSETAPADTVPPRSDEAGNTGILAAKRPPMADDPIDDGADSPDVPRAPTPMPAGPLVTDPAIALNTSVDQCDRPFNRFAQCMIDTVPAEALAQVMDAIRMSAEAFRDLAKTPEGVEHLKLACATAADAWYQGAMSVGCEW